MQEAPGEHSIPFRLFDDDGILYFSGMMSFKLHYSHRVLDPLDYAMPAWGCTEMRVMAPETDTWETV